MFSNKPGPVCTMAAAGADLEKVAPEEVRGTRGRAGPYGELGAVAGWADPRSGTPAWAGWCAWAGRGAVCAGCESGSCVEAEEAQRSGEMAAKVKRGSFVFFQQMCVMRHPSSRQAVARLGLRCCDHTLNLFLSSCGLFRLCLNLVVSVQVVSFHASGSCSLCPDSFLCKR